MATSTKLPTRLRAFVANVGASARENAFVTLREQGRALGEGHPDFVGLVKASAEEILWGAGDDALVGYYGAPGVPTEATKQAVLALVVLKATKGEA